MERGTVADTAGFNLTLNAGGATSGATDKAGGNLLLSSGISTGTGGSEIQFWTAPVSTTGTADNALTQKMVIDKAGNVGIGTTAPLKTLDVAGGGRFTGKASSTLTGTADPTASTTLVGTGTLFTTELVVGDRITVNAETRTCLLYTSPSPRD